MQLPLYHTPSLTAFLDRFASAAGYALLAAGGLGGESGVFLVLDDCERDAPS